MAQTTTNGDPRIAVVESDEDVLRGFDCVSKAFGNQVKDAIFIANNPGWDTVAGKFQCAARLVHRWKTATSENKDGQPNTIFLKATAPDPKRGEDRVVGLAIWMQCSMVDGYGDKPVENLGEAVDLEDIYPGNKAEQEYLTRLDRSFHAQRNKLIKEKANDQVPAVMILDVCVVDPEFQGRGIAKQLVQWGIDEAKKRGDLELITEGSAMGRKQYQKLGFVPQGEDIVYDVPEEFKDRESTLPPNVFMRTRPPV